MESSVAAALDYCGRGWSVVPLHDKRTPAVRWDALQERALTPEQIAVAWNPSLWVGIVLGRVSGVVRLDADGAGAEELERRGGPGETSEFTTPSGGRGYLYKYFEGMTTEVLWNGGENHNELRLQSCGAYTVLPPSPGYRWVRDGSPAQAPGWLLDYLAAKEVAKLQKDLRPTLQQPDWATVETALKHIPPDEYDTWVQVGMALKSAGDDKFHVWDAWSRGSGKYTPGECERKWPSFDANGGLTLRTVLWVAEKCGWEPPEPDEPLTDVGNARVLARMGAGTIAHSEKWGWLAWDGARWGRENAEKTVQELQKEVLKRRMREAVDALLRHMRSDPSAEGFMEERKRRIAAVVGVRKHEDEKHIRGSRILAESDPLLTCDHRSFDQHPWLLCCPNGVVDLRSAEAREHDPELKLTQLCPTEYKPGASAPRWERFLLEVFAGDATTVSYVQRLLGYCLTGCIREHVLPILWGSGRNGKSTLVKTFCCVLGEDYSCVTPPGLLMLQRGEPHPERFVVLYGKRFAADLETGDSARLNEEVIKRLTGGDRIRARDLYQSSWEFTPTHKMVLATNHEPVVQGVDEAIWARLKKVPFTVSFRGREERGLDETLQGEAEGILAWAVRGCLEWQERGLGEPPSVESATREYRAGQDRFAEFLCEKCDVGAELRCKRTPLQQAYKSWCVVNNERELSGRAVAERLRERGIEKDTTGNYYQGIKLKE